MEIFNILKFATFLLILRNLCNIPNKISIFHRTDDILGIHGIVLHAYEYVPVILIFELARCYPGPRQFSNAA